MHICHIKKVEKAFESCREGYVARMGAIREGGKQTCIPMLVSKLTKDYKRKILKVLSLVKKKRYGKFMGRVVAGEKKRTMIH